MSPRRTIPTADPRGTVFCSQAMKEENVHFYLERYSPDKYHLWGKCWILKTGPDGVKQVLTPLEIFII